MLQSAALKCEVQSSININGYLYIEEFDVLRELETVDSKLEHCVLQVHHKKYIFLFIKSWIIPNLTIWKFHLEQITDPVNKEAHVQGVRSYCNTAECART